MNPAGLQLPALDDLLAALDGSPVGLYLIPAIALIAGAFLWAAGGRALKPLFVIGATFAGAALGAARLTPHLAPHIQSFPPQYAGLGFGALAGLLLAVAFFRAVMGLAAALTLAAVASFIAAAAMGLRPGDLLAPEPPPAATPATAAALYERAVIVYGRAAPPALLQTGDEPGRTPATDPAPASALDTFKARAGALWSSLPDRARHNLAAAALAGAVLGLVIGVLAPRKSAALVTASLGAGLMLFAAASLIGTLGPDHTAARLLSLFNQRGPGAWLAAWGGLAFLGLAIQSHRRPKEQAARA